VSALAAGGDDGVPGPGDGVRRGRRPRTQAAVLAATARLLETIPLAELSVAQILDAAGVGRTSFYEHFASKDDVMVKLLRSVSADIAAEIEPMFARGRSAPEPAFREALTRLIRMWDRYAPLMLTGTGEWPSVPELQDLWFRIHADLTRRVAAIIEADRDAGLAPPGADATALAAGLVWSTERALLISSTGRIPALPDHAAVIEPLVQLYVGTIYGRPSPVAPVDPVNSGRRAGSGAG
jgi:TetR/AcrR family transcriptional regulator, ethionamide resistance regulator